MKRPVVQARRGIALVITLLMLSVVTITAVAFLAVSRRERGAVNAQGEQIEARYAADAALNRVKAELASRIQASGNRAALGLMVSTNYINPFSDQNLSYADVTNRDYLTNVSYQGPFTASSYPKMLANLYYDPRAPVFVPTNNTAGSPPDFRFYLDINRNGRFETNGWQLPRDASDQAILTAAREFMVGDPEWIGMLERPNLPHSGSNRFGGRFAFLVLPAGRGMDVNYDHNSVKVRPDVANPTTNQIATSFMRDQGVGGWELNLAGFLTDLNTNVWPGTGLAYNYQPVRTLPNAGQAFTDAGQFLITRRQVAANRRNPSTATEFFKAEGGQLGLTAIKTLLVNQNRTNAVDWYSDGMITDSPIRTLAEILNPPPGNDDPTHVWPGGDYTNSFTDVFQFFAVPNVGPALAVKSTPQQSTNRTYDRYTFQRLLAQLGTDGSDARFENGFSSSLINTAPPVSDPNYNPDGFYRRAKLNLNFRQADPNGSQVTSANVAPFQDWAPLEWFTNASHRLLLTEFTNGLPRKLSAVDGSPGIAVNGYFTNRFFANQIYQTNAYTAQLHRLLQVAANIYDYATNRMTDYPPTKNSQSFPFLPSVFQPVLYHETNPRIDSPTIPRSVARIARFDAVTNNVEKAGGLLQQPWVDLDDADFTRTFGVGFKTSGQYVLPDAKNSATDNLQGINSLTKGQFVNVPLVIGAKKGLPNFNEGLWQSAVQVTRRLFVSKPTPKSKLTLGQLPFGHVGGFTTEAQYRFDLTNHFAVEAWNSYSSNIYPKGLTRGTGVRVIATNVLSFGLFHDRATNATDAPIVSSSKVTVPAGSSFVKRGSYLVSGVNFDLGTPTKPWNADTFIRVLNDQLRFHFTYTPGRDGVNDLALSGNTNLDHVDVDLSRPPMLHLFVTNRMMYALVDIQSGALLDYVNLKSVVAEVDVLRFFGAGRSAKISPLPPVLTGVGTPISMPAIWDTNALRGFGAVGPTYGISNQFAASLGQVDVGNLWTDPVGQSMGVNDRIKAINGLYYFLYQQFPTTAALRLPDAQASSIVAKFASITNVQVGFNPSPTLFLTDRLQANDPLVHYTREDLAPGYTLFCDSGNYSEIPGPDRRLTSETDGFQLTTNSVADLTGLPLRTKIGAGGVVAYAPWGQHQHLQLRADAGAKDINYNLFYKDPQITGSDAWAFPTNAQTKFPGIGFLGRVHRGTPWQTIYLKSAPVVTNTLNGHINIDIVQPGFASDRVTAQQTWAAWSGSPATHPVYDWKFLDLFTTAINDNAARGLMSVNQTNIASWSALLSGVSLLDSSGTVDTTSSGTKPKPFELQPNSPELRKILTGYTNSDKTVVPGLLLAMSGTNSANQYPKMPVLRMGLTNAFYPGGSFTNLGSILSVPTLSDRAPFLFDFTKIKDWNNNKVVTDEVVERLPQQILSLLRADEPRVVVYSYGQSLRPALNSLITKPGNFYGLCTNYQITGEYVTKTTLRFDGSPGNLRTVVEDHRVLYPSN